MPASRAPTVRQRRLGAALRQLRDIKGLTSEEVAKELGWSASKISRIETARIGVRISDVRLLLEIYGVDEHQRGELLALAHDADRKGWWEAYSGLGTSYSELIALETEASVIRQWENSVVPGLLQTEAYAGYVVDGWNVVATVSPREIERRIEVRLRRQGILHQPQPIDLSVVLDEAVLWRRVGQSDVMVDQLRHLCTVADFPHVSLRILPLDSPHSILAASFTLLEFPSVHDVIFPDIVHTESLTFSYLEDEAETHMYRLAFERMAEEALSPAESITRITAIRDKWQ